MPDTHSQDLPPPAMKDVPIGIEAHGDRREFNSMGDVPVPADRYWALSPHRPKNGQPHLVAQTFVEIA